MYQTKRDVGGIRAENERVRTIAEIVRCAVHQNAPGSSRWVKPRETVAPDGTMWVDRLTGHRYMIQHGIWMPEEHWCECGSCVEVVQAVRTGRTRHLLYPA